MEKYLLIPVEGRLVRDPHTMQQIGADGVEVQKSSYWQRRIDDGDVTVSEIQPSADADADAQESPPVHTGQDSKQQQRTGKAVARNEAKQ